MLDDVLYDPTSEIQERCYHIMSFKFMPEVLHATGWVSQYERLITELHVLNISSYRW